MSQLDTILFDLDGTLVDTEPAAAKAVGACLASWGIALRPGDAAYVTGRTWKTAVEYFAERVRFPFPLDVVEAKLLEAYRAELVRELRVVPGAAEAVRRLAPHYRLGLVSGSRRAEILWALGELGISELFEVILGAEDYPRSKPEPDGYLSAMRHFGREGSQCLVFEDSAAGIESARGASAWVVAVTCTNHFAQATHLAHHHVEDLRPVTPEWVQALARRLGC